MRLSKQQYIYILTDGIYCKIRMDNKLCLLVVIDIDDASRKEIIDVVDGYRESEISWLKVLS
ncbi:transposase [Candidatus Enterovibrio escicola]|uniref:transposase n=1 Tax=Candidatus Enterovibrio escicola TaxID=1927127 RepID=UPI001237D1EE|nr:transposase [Candidatus Enterovibrio escacola]